MEILLIEDNPSDVALTRLAMKACKVTSQLHVAGDGVEALAFLRREGKHADAVRPDLVLLDLNLPGMDGRQVLAAIKEDETLQTIPVVVLTTSDAERDVSGSYALHANAYVTKPVDLGEFIRIFKGLEEFWFGTVELPHPKLG